MRPVQRGLLGCGLGVLVACATPGQVRRVETQVAILDRDHARADSARAAELARLQSSVSRGMDSLRMLIGELNDNVQRNNRDNVASFDALRQQLYQVANLANSTQSRVANLGTALQTAISTTPATGDTTRSAAGLIPSADVLLSQGTDQLLRSPVAARTALNTLLQTYPNAPQVPDAVFLIGKSFDPADADSARAYYTRVWKNYPESVRAPTALYKLGMLELREQHLPAARAYWQQIVRQYQRADEYESAQARLRENP